MRILNKSTDHGSWLKMLKTAGEPTHRFENWQIKRTIGGGTEEQVAKLRLWGNSSEQMNQFFL